MKQGIKTIQNLYEELERQREVRQDLIADTRSLNVSSTNGVSMLTVATDNDVLSYSIVTLLIVSWLTALIFPTSIMNVCVWNIPIFLTRISMVG